MSIIDRSGGSALLLAARAAVSLAYGLGKLSGGIALRVDASPVSGFSLGTSIAHWLAIALISGSS